ncbi:MAG: hypothetical protein LC768_07895, partial [Acidobacteria bacterium]|nr:hypothetical protein [Acidobacteriota bacterium]
MRRIFILWVILFLPSIFFAQVENIQWTRIESPKSDLSFAVPPNFLIDNEDGEYRAIAFHDEAMMRVSIQETGSAKARIKEMRQFPPRNADVKVSRFTLGDFIGDFYIDEKDEGFMMSIYVASSKAFYTSFSTTRFLNANSHHRFIVKSNRPILSVFVIN